MPTIYILLTNTRTAFSRLIGWSTGETYTHVAIALDRELRKVYSFARRNPRFLLPAGLVREDVRAAFSAVSEEERLMAIDRLEEQMLAAAGNLDFEKAAKLRDQMLELRGEKPQATNEKSRLTRRRRKK